MDDQETDVWWGGYSARAMAPEFSACAIISGLLGLTSWLLWDEDAVHPQIAWHLTMFGVAAVWAVPLLRCGFRLVARNYRLTNRRLLVDRGFGRSSSAAVDLNSIELVRAEHGPVEHWLGVGRVVVESNTGRPTLVIDGVYQPARVAARLRRQLRRIRKPDALASLTATENASPAKEEIA